MEGGPALPLFQRSAGSSGANSRNATMKDLTPLAFPLIYGRPLSPPYAIARPASRASRVPSWPPLISSKCRFTNEIGLEGDHAAVLFCGILSTVNAFGS